MIAVPSLRIATILLAALLAAAALPAQTGESRLAPFDEFRDGLRTAGAASFLSRAESRVTDRAAFEEMRRHLVELYAEMIVAHSYLLHGDVFDCVPVEQQPSVRLLHLGQIADPPPPLPSDDRDASDASIRFASQVQEDELSDRFGNSTQCEDGTFPMRRITLDEMARFPSLAAFLAKSPGESAPLADVPPCSGPTCGHKYSFTYQYVKNLGGSSSLNIWSPAVNTGDHEVFSLAQQWFIAGTGTATQTVEAGWQNYPAKYGNQNSRLFIFHTPDNYKTGCYNLDCAGFVQTGKNVHLGGAFTVYSSTGGAQYEFSIQAKLYKGNWWLYYRGSAFGYYPGSIYKSGALTKGSTLIEFGTESYATSTVWPPEGSGAWSNEGFGTAAYQRDLYYYSTSGRTEWDTLGRDQPSLACYTINGPTYSSVPGWAFFFYEGGPGGRC